jgi:phospholipase D1/2
VSLAAARRTLFRLAPAGFLALALLAIWTVTPLRQLADREHLLLWGQAIRADPLAPFYVVLFFVASGFVVLPVTVLVAATVALFRGPEGLALALLGMLASGSAFYAIGRVAGARLIEWIDSARLDRLRDRLAGRGIVTVAIVRALPIAPFTIVNLVAGAVRLRPRDFFVGSLIGLLPGMLGFGLIGEAIAMLWERPSARNLIWLGIGMVAVIALGWGVRRWLIRRAAEPDSQK